MQVGSSFTGSTNAKRFAGGQYVDGFVANMPGVLLDKSDDGYKITIGGLYREPQLPTSFVFGSDLYRITLATRVETPYFGAKTLLAANKTFIQTETIAWINSPSGFPNLNYDEDICYRDVGLIVDAVMEDLLYGGYRHSSQAGRLYFSSGSTIIAGQVTQTAAAIRHARDIAIKCIKQELFTPVLGSAGQTTIPSITDGATAQTIVDNCFEIIANIVQYGEAMYKAKALIQANKELIQVETVKFVDQYYPSLNYLKDTCKRDVGLIVDAIAIDMFGDFTESLRAGYSYYRQGVLVYAQDQIPAETDAVNFIGSTITDIIQNITISPLRSKQTFNPSSAVSISANTITLPSHPFTNGSKVQYSNGGGSSITTDFGTLSTVDPYYVYVIDADTIQLFESFDLIVAAEKGLSTALAINITGSGSGSSHTIQFYQTKDLTLSGVDLTNAKVLTGTSTGTIDTAVGYINTIAAGGDSTTVPDIYPQYNCVLDTPYNAMVGGKVILRTPGNKSMLNNDFTQVNDLGYGIFANNNGLIESVSLFTYYCYTAYYSLNGGQIRSVGGSCCNGVYGLRAEGADPNEVPDSVNLKFPLAQTATSYENALLSISNAKGSLTLYVTNYSYLPRNGCVVDIDHTGDSGAGVTLGWRTYNVVGVSTTGLPTGVAALSLANVTSASGVTGIANDLTSKSLIIRQSGELVISGKDAIVSTRPSTALVFSESTANVIRVTAFNPYLDVGAADKDVLVTTRDGFSYVSLPVKKNDTTFTIPPGFGNAGDDYIAIQPLSTANAARLTYQTTGYTVYPSTTGTGGQIFGYQDSIYEITGYTLVNTGLPNAYAKVTFNNVTNPNAATARGTVSAVTKANPAVVTTTQAHMMTDGKKVKFTGVGGMTELNFSGSNYYYIKRQTNTVNITATAAGTNYVTLGSAVSTPALATGQAVIVSGSIGGLVSIQDYFVHRVINSTTITVSTYRINATATIVSTDPSRPNQIVVDDTSKLSLNQAIIFYGTGFGGIVSGTTYYVLSIPDTTHITITATISGTTPVTLTTASGYIWGGTTATLSNATGSVSTVIRSFDSFELYSDSALTTAVNSTGYTTFTSGGTVSAMGGLTYSINNSASNVSLNAGIRGGATGTVTVNISTMRATSVDFLDIGTGSYADTNYPSDIFGPPANTPDVAKQVLEQNKGRVFYVSTDQNGTFKVGDFFGVDQGTGNLTLSAKINLAGIETLRLKSGVEINEFSNDTTLGGTGPAPSTSTPTSNAVRTYIDSRLGLSNSGTIVTTGLVGPGYMALDGTLGMKGPMDLNNNRIINVASPTSANDAVPRNYMKLLNLEDGTTTGASSGDLLTFTGTAAGFTKATVTGAITLNRSGTTLTSTLASNYVTDNNIAYTAAIGQYKLNLNTLKAKAADGLQITSYTNQTVGAPRVTLTATLHGFVNGESVVISGETSITSLNGQWTVYNVTTNTFDIALAIPSGTLSSTIRVRSFGLLSAADSAVFTVSANGFLSLNDSTSTTSGVRFTKLAYIDPSVYDATDNQSLSGNSTKVLARRATPASGTAIGAPVPVDARTIVEDGDGLSRAEVPSVGAVVRTATGTGSGKFSTIGYSSTTAVGGLNLVQRDASNGFSAGAVSVTGLTSSGEITLAGGGSINAVGSLGIKMTVNSTTSTVLSRVLDNAGSQAYYVALRDGNGNTAIRLNTGTSAAYQYNAYYATIHNFWDATGSNAGTINVNNGGTLSTGAAANTGQIVGNWSIGSGSRFSATWADLAEWYTSDQEYEPGTIVEFGGSAEVTKSSKAATTRIAGVVSTNPAYVMNGECPGTRVCVALQGRVPCKVVGKISKGDLIVSSQIPGVAISSGEEAKPGTIIGKALENYDSDRIGTIEVAVGRL